MSEATTDESYTIVTSGARTFERRRVLSQADTFGVFDPRGDVLEDGELGLYHDGTRFLSRLELRIETLRPLLLSSTVKATNDLLVVDLTNPDLLFEDGTLVPRGTIHVFRSRFLWQGVCYEQLRIANHGLSPVALALDLVLEADFADIFEVRGARRPRRGSLLPPQVGSDELVLGYVGRDGVARRARVRFEPAPQRLRGSLASFELRLDPQDMRTVFFTCACEIGENAPAPSPFAEALATFSEWLSGMPPGLARIETSSQRFDYWIDRSIADLRMLTSETRFGLYPYAGVPWFNTIFGRDGILTALELLWLDPRPARGVLTTLAATQAQAFDPDQDAEPGRILHETRRGEMAALREIPFGTYYGSVDATPLFVVLAGEYFERTGDRAFIEQIWPNIERALAWMDGPGDVDGDGFVEYARRTPLGLQQQGWKDSADSISHADGSIAQGPVALSEVQGYVYAARRFAAALAQMLGRSERARSLLSQAAALRTRFNRAFWSERLGSYALALDGAKNPCLVHASNAGHCLYSGIVPGRRARRTAQTLLEPDLFSGWGVRTLSTRERRYNPMSYHNGSVWPHDNAIIALGLARCGMTSGVPAILEGMLQVSDFVDLHRMPELFCGFKRRPGQGPTLYPAACSPQAWSAGAVFMLLQASVGLSISAVRRRIVLRHPVLPGSLAQLTLRELAIGDASVDLVLERHTNSVSVRVQRRHGDLEVLVVE